MKPSDIMKAMADETRLRILILLVQEELCVSALEKILHLNQSNVSRHLAKLLAVSLVCIRRDARHIHYRLNRDFFDAWPGLYRHLLNLTSHPEYQTDLAALEAYRNTGQEGDEPIRKSSDFSPEDLI